MLSGELVKATITNLDTDESVEVMFNPTEYSFSKANNWQPSKKKGANVPPLEFNGGNPTGHPPPEVLRRAFHHRPISGTEGILVVKDPGA